MADLDAPESPDELYEARGDEVSLARPILQGDVFDGIELPGLGADPGLALILSHACSMRAGPRLKPFVTMGRIKQRSQQIRLEDWSDGYLYALPLPELQNPGAEDLFFYADFNEISAVRSESLDRQKRVACLSSVGLQLLQQRQAFHYTRVKVDLGRIHEQLSPVITETELSQDWVEEALLAQQNTGDTLDLVKEQEVEFQTYLGLSSDSPRRRQLKEIRLHSGLRSEVRQEIRQRFRQS